ncbi:MAG: CapA family protein [Chloroflexota bacterium]
MAGDDARFAALELVDSDADAILSALGLDRGRLGGRLVSAPDARRLATDLAAHRDRLAFLPADQIGPSVRALGWGGSYLFGNARVRSLAAWKLRARVAVPADASTRYDPRRAWSLVAGGDILLDRGVALAIKANRRAADFPFDGGTADILSRYCCSSFGWDLPRTARTGNGGAMRDLLSSADLTIANFENPAPTSFRFHAKGTVFSANPAYIKGLKNAGIDWVSLANNHIGDAGRAGIASTMQNLDRFGIRHGGAGRNLAEARKPVILEVGGTRVGLLAYDTIAKYYAAKGGTAGSAQLTKSAVATDVARARAAGAELVIVFPHWGVEYRARPFDAEQALARAAIDAGADMVIGNHAHWAGGMEVYKGKPIWYALGNFVFDQTWSEPTMEGMTLELTFDGARLIQVRLHPHVILDRGQPNLLDPAGDGRVVLGQVFRASKGLLKW